MEPDEERLAPGQLYRLAWGFYLVVAIAGVVWIGAREGSIGVGLFVGDRWWIDLALGLAAGGGLLALWAGAARVSALARELESRLSKLLGPIDTSQAIGLALLSGLAEEIFFRGAVQGSWGYLWASALFAVLHTGREAPFRLWTAFAAVAGLTFGALVLATGTLLAPVVAHTVVNGVNLVRLARREE